MAKFLNVFFGESKVGVLKQDSSGAMWFSYDEAWLNSDHAAPLSISLPLQSERFKAKECRPYFAGVLPEEGSRTAVASKFGVSERNDYAILEKIGAECAGAVSLLPPGQNPPFEKSSYREISKFDLEEKLRGLPVSPLLTGEERVRLSLAGAQGKAALMIRNGSYFLPLDGAASTHILKPESERFEGLVKNEFFCMTLAGAVRLDVAAVERQKTGVINFLQIERYDRESDGHGGWTRFHQEDFCQALGIPPEFKYQEEGGPGLKKCFELVKRVCSVPVLDVLKLFDAVVFNYLIGNNDAHGKNFSLLYIGGNIQLAPLYDLVSTSAYPELSQHLAMKIGGERNAGRLYASHWLAFFREVELNPTMAIERMKKLAMKVDKAAEVMNSTTSEFDVVASIVRARCESVRLLRWKT